MFITNLLIWVALLGLAVFFIWLAIRAWRARRWYIRWPGVILSAIAALFFLLLVWTGGSGLYTLYAPTGNPAPEIQVDATPERIARGEYLANAFCTGCHSLNGELPLTGGFDMANDLPMPLGSFVSANLTPSGRLKDWTDGEILRALREGVDNDGRYLVTMNTIYTRYLSDEDLMSLIAYLRNSPAAGQDIPQPLDRPNFLSVLVTGAGLIPPLPPVTGSISAPPKAATVEYGQYILSYQDCRVCHGVDLLGGTSQFTPNGPSLRPVRRMTQDQFIAMMRTGNRPEGGQLQPLMPWQMIGRMDDEELAAMYQYLLTIP